MFCDSLFSVHTKFKNENYSKSLKFEKLDLCKGEGVKIIGRTKILHLNKFDVKKLKIDSQTIFSQEGKKRNSIRFSSLQKYDKLAQLTNKNSVNQKTSVNHNLSFQLAPIKLAGNSKQISGRKIILLLFPRIHLICQETNI